MYLLLCGMILALPALCGFMDYSFMPYVYILLVVLYWTAGHYNRFILRKVFASGKEMPSFGIQCLLTVTVTLLGAGLFSVVFNLCNELQYGIWASTCLLPFVFPLLYTQTVNSYFDIPIEIYKVWKYSEEYDSDTLRINRKRSIVMDVEIFRKVDDPASERITGKASEDVIFRTMVPAHDRRLQPQIAILSHRVQERGRRILRMGILYQTLLFQKAVLYRPGPHACRQQAETARCNHSQACGERTCKV